MDNNAIPGGFYHDIAGNWVQYIPTITTKLETKLETRHQPTIEFQSLMSSVNTHPLPNLPESSLLVGGNVSGVHLPSGLSQVCKECGRPVPLLQIARETHRH